MVTLVAGCSHSTPGKTFSLDPHPHPHPHPHPRIRYQYHRVHSVSHQFLLLINRFEASLLLLLLYFTLVFFRSLPRIAFFTLSDSNYFLSFIFTHFRKLLTSWDLPDWVLGKTSERNLVKLLYEYYYRRLTSISRGGFLFNRKIKDFKFLELIFIFDNHTEIILS